MYNCWCGIFLLVAHIRLPSLSLFICMMLLNDWSSLLGEHSKESSGSRNTLKYNKQCQSKWDAQGINEAY